MLFEKEFEEALNLAKQTCNSSTIISVLDKYLSNSKIEDLSKDIKINNKENKPFEPNFDIIEENLLANPHIFNYHFHKGGMKMFINLEQVREISFKLSKFTFFTKNIHTVEVTLKIRILYAN